MTVPSKPLAVLKDGKVRLTFPLSKTAELLHISVDQLRAVIRHIEEQKDSATMYHPFGVLRNAIFLEDPQNAWKNTLTLIFNADKINDPAAQHIVLDNIHPTLGRYIERFLKHTKNTTAPGAPNVETMEGMIQQLHQQNEINRLLIAQLRNLQDTLRQPKESI